MSDKQPGDAGKVSNTAEALHTGLCKFKTATRQAGPYAGSSCVQGARVANGLVMTAREGRKPREPASRRHRSRSGVWQRVACPLSH